MRRKSVLPEGTDLLSPAVEHELETVCRQVCCSCFGACEGCESKLDETAFRLIIERRRSVLVHMLLLKHNERQLIIKAYAL